jgi:hypothetical protein
MIKFKFKRINQEALRHYRPLTHQRVVPPDPAQRGWYRLSQSDDTTVAQSHYHVL